MGKKSLHPVQKKLIDVLLNNIEEPLTIREMQDLLRVSSTSVVAHHLCQLEKRGYLKRNPHNPRDYHVLSKGPERRIIHLNLYGLAQCGPHGSILDGNPLDRISVPSRLVSFPADDAFLVQAKGDSMTPRISDGDLVVVRKTEDTDSGRVVVCINEGEALIKKLQKERDRCILISSNPNHPPFLAGDDFRIVGEVKAIMSHNVQ
jgi:repressor LexA